MRHLQSLHKFVSRATAELIWLNEKEEEELAYDWSDNNPNISAKRNYFSVSLVQQAYHVYLIVPERKRVSLLGFQSCSLRDRNRGPTHFICKCEKWVPADRQWSIYEGRVLGKRSSHLPPESCRRQTALW